MHSRVRNERKRRKWEKVDKIMEPTMRLIRGISWWCRDQSLSISEVPESSKRSGESELRVIHHSSASCFSLLCFTLLGNSWCRTKVIIAIIERREMSGLQRIQMKFTRIQMAIMFSGSLINTRSLVRQTDRVCLNRRDFSKSIEERLSFDFVPLPRPFKWPRISQTRVPDERWASFLVKILHHFRHDKWGVEWGRPMTFLTYVSMGGSENHFQNYEYIHVVLENWLKICSYSSTFWRLHSSLIPIRCDSDLIRVPKIDPLRTRSSQSINLWSFFNSVKLLFKLRNMILPVLQETSFSKIQWITVVSKPEKRSGYRMVCECEKRRFRLR